MIINEYGIIIIITVPQRKPNKSHRHSRVRYKSANISETVPDKDIVLIES